MARSLYICYFGMQEPLVQTQVLPYLRELVKGGHEMALLTFEPTTVEKNEKADNENIRTLLAAQGIEWHWLRYHKRPSIPATLFDLANGVRAALKIARRKKIDIFHIRGHIPAPIGVIAKHIRGGKVLFDIRGFLPEEYVDAGIWDPNGTVYSSFKQIEKWLMRSADGFVVLTEKARDVLFPEARATGLDDHHRPVEVIPCCLDFSRASINLDQRDKIRADLGVADRFVLIHVGSLGGLYLTDKIIELMAASKKRDPTTFALFLTRHNAEPIFDKLRLAGFAQGSYIVKSVRPEAVFYFLVAADAAISIVKESYSSASRSPTKIAEYLAAGLPIISSPNIGDTDRLVISQGVGVTVDEYEPSAYKLALEKLSQILSDNKLRDRCVAVAHEQFDLETVGGPRYRRIYERLLAGDQK